MYVRGKLPWEQGAWQPQRLRGWGSKTLRKRGGARAGWRASAAPSPSQWRWAGIRWQRAHDSGAATRSPVLGASPPGAGPARKVGSGTALRPPGQLQAHCPPPEEHSAASALECPGARLDLHSPLSSPRGTPHLELQLWSVSSLPPVHGYRRQLGPRRLQTQTHTHTY